MLFCAVSPLFKEVSPIDPAEKAAYGGGAGGAEIGRIAHACLPQDHADGDAEKTLERKINSVVKAEDRQVEWAENARLQKMHFFMGARSAEVHIAERLQNLLGIAAEMPRIRD